MLQAKVGSSSERFAQHEPFIQMLKAKVAYAEGRNKVDANFAALLRRVVDEAKNAATLKQARLFMEAFMAFYKVHGPKSCEGAKQMELKLIRDFRSWRVVSNCVRDCALAPQRARYKSVGWTDCGDLGTRTQIARIFRGQA